MSDGMHESNLKGEGAEVLSDYLYTLLDKWKTARKGWTERWMQNWFNYIGYYQTNATSRAKEGEGRRSKAFIKFTKAKVMSGFSSIVAISFQNQSLFNVEPRLRQSTDMEKNRARAMRDEIAMQHNHVDFKDKLMGAVQEKCLYGTTYMEGPVTRVETINTWQSDTTDPMMLMMGAQPRWSVTPQKVIVPQCYHRNLFDIYPDPHGAGRMGQGVFFAPFVSDFEIASLTKIPGFDSASIKALLKDGMGSWEASDVESRKMAARGTANITKEGFELVLFYGVINAEKLGKFKNKVVKDEAFLGNVEVFVWMGKGKGKARILKVAQNPYQTKLRPLHRGVFELNPFEVNGTGIAENINDIQDIMNSAVRLYIDSKSFAGIPMVGINRSLLHIKGGKLGIAPGKVFEFTGDPNLGLKTLTINDTSDGILKLIELIERFGDETSGGGTKYTSGTDSKSLNRTASGISMIMNAASQKLKTVGENIDRQLIEPIANGYYNWNMEFNDDENIKGDYIVSGGGVSNAMAKEILNQQLMQFLGVVMNPMIYQLPPALKLVRMIGENMGIKNIESVIPDDTEAKSIADDWQRLQVANPTGGNGANAPQDFANVGAQ